MRVLALFLLCIVAISSASAQPPDTLWTRLWSDEGTDLIRSVEQTEDEGFIFTGRTAISDNDEPDLLIIKTDSNGEEEWNQVYRGETEDEGRCVVQTDDGGYIVIGQTNSMGAGEYDIWLIKLDSQGEEEWNQTYGGTDIDKGRSIIQTDDGGYIFVGLTYSIGSGSSDAWLIKTDADGEEVWSQTFGGVDFETAYSVELTTDGGYVICGRTESFGEGQSDIWLIKTDSEGEEEWNQTYGGNLREYGAGGILQTADGGYIIAGSTESINGQNMDWWLIKTDSEGEIEWDETYGGNNFDICTSVEITQDGGYILGGWTPSFGEGSVDAWVVKTDSEGQEQWSQTYGTPYGDSAMSVRQTSDGGYIVAGDKGSENGSDAWLIRLGADTSVEEPDSPIPSEFVLDKIYPNPFNSMTTISVELPHSSDLKLFVYNINGQEVAVLSNQNHSEGYHSFTFNADDLSSGIYFVHALVKGKLNQIQKIVLIR
jgi:Secretion system C-terminal sorting domain